MSELMSTNGNRATIRWKLLTGASTLALAVYVSSHDVARAEETHPLIWLDLGGQMELLQGGFTPFTANFMDTSPDPGSYSKDIFSRNQRVPRFSFGMEGSISFQPQGSDWIVSAAIRYARAHTNEHGHQQGPHPYVTWYNPLLHHISTPPALAAGPVAGARSRDDESHAIIDFSAGKDVGLGMLRGDSTIGGGVRFVQFSADSAVDISARPHIGSVQRLGLVGFGQLPLPTFHQYFLTGEAEREFRGVGPSLTWNASAPIAGNADDGELSIDWGLNGAVLFGRQKAKVKHGTQEYFLSQLHCTRTRSGVCKGYKSGYPLVYHHPTNAPAYDSTRSRRVTVPDIGGFVALTAQFKDAKVSIGYRADLFIDALDTGIDARKSSNVLFHGPYASISIGLGD